MTKAWYVCGSVVVPLVEICYLQGHHLQRKVTHGWVTLQVRTGNGKWEMRNGKQGNGKMERQHTSGESVYKKTVECTVVQSC